MVAAQPTPPGLGRIYPASLLELAQWVTWRREQRQKPNGDIYWTKVPYNPRNGHKAQTNNPRTWGTFAQATAAAKRARHDGVGFVVTREDPFVGIDLDHCRDAVTGELEAWARAIVEQMRSYTEVSPSGTGLRILVQGTLPPQHRKDGDIEMYESGRFFTMTGLHLNGTPPDIEARQEALAALHDAVFAARIYGVDEAQPLRHKGQHPGAAGVTRLDDAAILKSAQAAKNGAKFARLWNGDTSDYRADASRADMALCGMLAFWIGPDAARIDRMFRQSGLMREKWDEARGSSSYGARTIAAVLSTAREFYTDPKVTPLRAPERTERPEKREWRTAPPTDGSSALKPDETDSEHGGNGGHGDSPNMPPPGVSMDGLAHLTDLGNARRLVARHGENLRFVATWNQWLVWDGTRWRRDATGEVYRLAKETVAAIYLEAAETQDSDRRKEIAKWSLRSESDARVRAMLWQAQSEPEISCESDDFDRWPFLLTCENGTLDLRSGKLLSHDRRHLLTRLAPVAYEAPAACPTWLAFLTRIMDGDDELIAFLQRAVGYSLTDDTSEQVLFLLHGNGQNGKSKFLEAIEGVAGDYGMQTPTTTLMAKRDNNIPNDVARLKGARFVKAIETDEGHALAESLVKQMTGGDMLSARFMRGEWFDFKPTFKLWLAANHLPTIRGNDDGIWRRIRYIPFEVQIPEAERDNHLGDKLMAEYPGILAWAVQGCLQWQRQGLRPPEKVTRATSQYRSAMDRFSAFLDDCCVLHPNATVSAKRLRKVYEDWCTENGERPRSASWVGQQLQRRRIESSRSDKNGATVYYGLGLVEFPVQRDFGEEGGR